MSDENEGMDPCECMWSHEMAMRRLLSLLRQSQAYCTDDECLEELPGGQLTSSTPNSFIMITMCWIALALALFFLRPNAFRSRGDEKPHDNGHGSSGGAPPSPPPAVD